MKFVPKGKKVVKSKKTVKTAKATAIQSEVKKIVKQEIARNIENKTQQLYVAGHTLVSSTALGFNTQNVIDVGLSSTAISISQGTGQGNRIGNHIKIKKLEFVGTFLPLPYSVSNNPIPKPLQVTAWLCYNKDSPTVAPLPQSDFFQFGNTSAAFSGDLVDLWAPVNSDKYRVLAKRSFKVGYASYGESGVGYPTAAGTNSNNDFKLNHNLKWDITKHCIKNVDFIDGNVDPSTRGLYMVIAYSSADGSIFSPTVIAMDMSYMVNCVYEDA